MKITRKGYRFFQYFSEGLSFLSLPLSVVNFVTVVYYLLVGNVSVLKAAFPSIEIFTVVSLGVLVPLAIGTGWVRMKRSLFYGEQSVVMTESNPLAVHGSRVLYDMELLMLNKLNIEPSVDFVNLLEYWRRLDKAQDWRPPQ